jgi:methionine synthase / methylenetetrahydrofolate reductase(NADPH)
MSQLDNRLLQNISPILWRGREVILSDGAMATFLHQCGVPIRSCSEALNLTNPEQVREVHEAYVESGVNVIQTNTFSANKRALARFGKEEQVEAINRAGARIALEAANGKVAVYGTIGSILGIQLASSPFDSSIKQELRAEYANQASALLTEHVHGLLLETFPDLEEMLLAISVIRELTDLPIIANLAPEELLVTRDGTPIDVALQAIQAAGATVAGLNCKLGPNGILRAYEHISLSPDKLYAAVPNAGLLHLVDGDIAYTGSEQYFATMTEKLLERGVSWVGGCCGTTPAHIHEARLRIDRGASRPDEKADISVESAEIDLRRSYQRDRILVRPLEQRVAESESGSRLFPASQSIVEQVARDVTVIVELDPPKTLDCGPFLKGASALKLAGADYITLADNSLATVRVSNLAMATLLKLNHIDSLVHVACRDRNLIGQQSHLMGLDVLGFRNVLLITGDPSKYGDLPGATSVYDVPSIDLTKMVRRLNEGIGFSGRVLERPAKFVIGTSFNPHLLKLQKGKERLRRKVDAGADFVMTQPIFDISQLERLKRAAEAVNVPVFVGIMPLTSERNALFLHHEVPGISIPDEILTRMRSVDREQAAEEGIRIAEELIDEAMSMFKGIYLITPFLRYQITEHLTKYIKSKKAVATNLL